MLLSHSHSIRIQSFVLEKCLADYIWLFRVVQASGLVLVVTSCRIFSSACGMGHGNGNVVLGLVPVGLTTLHPGIIGKYPFLLIPFFNWDDE